MPQPYSKKGFTLIELLVVIVVIGILASLATVGMKSARSKATDSKKVSEVRSLSTALEMYMMDEGKYPANIQDMWGQPLVGPTSGKTYMTLPKQLSGNAYGTYCRGNDSIYIYNWINNGTSYTLSYCLDNPMNSCPPGPKTARPNLIMDCENQTSACLPSCTNNDGTHRSCGDNGCGGSCGGCGGSLVCKEDTGTCVACNGDGDCTGTNQHCIDNNCLPCRTGVTADCSLCQTCNASNTCDNVPVDTVEGRCTTTGCGTGKCTADQTCGFNNNFEVCTGGFCIADGSCCTPETCASRGFNCGTAASNSCTGYILNCGTCTGGLACTDNVCCTPKTAAEACGNKCSGTVIETNCGSTITCNSSVCASNSCVDGTCCIAESLATTCAGNKCGMVTNNCGQSVDCGTSQCNDSNPCTDDVCSATTNTCSNPTKNCGSKFCRPSDGVCVDCLSNANCTGSAKYCNLANNTCVGCLNNSHCGKCSKCSGGACIAQAANEDLKNECDTTGCLTGNCNGGYGCAVYNDTSQHNCPANNNCYGGSCCFHDTCGYETGLKPGQPRGCGMPSCNIACTYCQKPAPSNRCGSIVTAGLAFWTNDNYLNCSYCGRTGGVIYSGQDPCTYCYGTNYVTNNGFTMTSACTGNPLPNDRQYRCRTCN